MVGALHLTAGLGEHEGVLNNHGGVFLCDSLA
jgi:hypothetical protein